MNQNNFLHHILTNEETRQLKQFPVLVALSGGADSVALLHILLEAGADCRAAHCNFHLRGQESMRDELFVRDLCMRLDVPLTVKEFDVAAYQQEHGGSVEMACRELRYSWFEQERQRLGCGKIAVAHHADDQVETFFLNLTRGTGVKGLAGMERVSGNIWRPLLGVRRQEILDYLARIGQDYVTDSTNDQNDYRRNRLRNIVLPVISEQFPQVHDRIHGSMGNLLSDYRLMMTLIKDALPDERHINIERLCAHPQASTLLYHRIRNLGFNRDQCIQAIEAAQRGHTGRHFIGKGNLMVVNRQNIDIEEYPVDQDIEIPLDLHTGLLSPVCIDVCLCNPPFSPLMCDGKNKVAFDAAILNCKHIVLRHWRKGDRIKPYGMKGSKLVSDLFADLKLDHASKQTAWLLEADGDILWVLGHRASALFSVPRESQDYLLITLS